MATAIRSADERSERLEGVDELIAYAARYGRQPVDVLEARPRSWLEKFVRELSKIVKEENKNPSRKE